MTATPADNGDTMQHLTASAVVFDHNGPDARVLLVHHRLTRKWQFPGGHVEPGEEPAACAAREAHEETGIPVDLVPPPHLATPVPGGAALHLPLSAAVFPAPADPGTGEAAHRHVDLLYAGIAGSGNDPVGQDDEVHAARWFTPADVAADPAVRPDVPALLPLARTWVGAP